MSGGQGLEAHIVRRRGEFELDMTLDLEPGTTTAVVGPNGSGKTTAVEVLAGLQALDAGVVRLDGRVLDDPAQGRFVPPEQRNIGVVFQDHLLFDHFDAQANVAFGLVARGVPKRTAVARARHLLEVVGLADVADLAPQDLSGGQAQRVALARALAIEPDLLLLDEPLAAVDVATRAQLRRVIGEHLHRFAGPRLMITHDPTDALVLAERIVVLEHGRITQDGSPEDIRQHPATPYVAALAGVNLLVGDNRDGEINLVDHGHVLQTSDTHTVGPVLVTIHPTAVALHSTQPHGSPRNVWETVVGVVEPLGETVRVTLGDPLGISVDVTPAAAAGMALRPGSAVWASVKATEVVVRPR